MIPWKQLGSATVPSTHAASSASGGELTLHQRGHEFSVRIGRAELMNSRAHGSEEALAELCCARIRQRPRACVLVGGLGMGFTLAAALRNLSSDARVVVAELVPEVVAWNRTFLADLAGNPLMDARVEVREQDVAEVLRSERATYDAILLDVDNGPEGLTHEANDWLYGRTGLACIKAALRPASVLGVWSAKPHEGFENRLARGGFNVEEHTVKARRERGPRHTIWVATRR